MKNILLTFFILLLIPISSFSNDEKVYKVVIRKDWKPYYFIDEKGKANGFAVKLFEKIAKKIDIKYKYVVVDSFDEVIKLFEEKKVDIVPNIGISPKREKLFLFTQPTDSFYINIYKDKNSKNIIDLKDIKNKRMGLVVNNICENLIDKNNYTRYFYNNYKDLISALHENKIDVFCYPKPLINDHLKKKENIESLKKSIKEVKRGIAISKDNFHLLPILNDALTELKLTGELDYLNKKWFDKENYIELTKSETLFLLTSFFGLTFTIIIIIFYISSKKRWLLTKDILEEEIVKKTEKLRIQNKKLKRIHKRLKEQSNKDPLTKIYNRRFYNEKIKEQLSLYNRYGNKFSYVMFDIDDFKKINDTYGHTVGDKILFEFASIVNKYIRVNDYFFRVGGEEFIVLLSDTSLQEAKIVTKKIKEAIANEVNIVESLTITVSIGLTEVKKGDVEENIYKRADENMYKAKNSGKNKIVSDDS